MQDHDQETRITKVTISRIMRADYLCASGVLVDDHPTNPRIKAGDPVITSEVIAIDGMVFLTKSGTRYRVV